LEEITTYVLKLYPNPKRNEKKKKSLEEKIQIEKKNQQTLEPNFYSANSLMITTNIDSQKLRRRRRSPIYYINEHVALLISITRKKNKTKNKPNDSNKKQH